MYDINKLIANETLARLDPQGNLAGLDPWSPGAARKRAEDEGLSLTEEHWLVMYHLRERFRERGQARSAREVLRELEGKFGDRKHLYTLFPRGPVSQASRIAGLPLPPYSSDPSFGSVQ
ncbi:MAG TPA: TusE/DsrC/DsvC family sulfur relay protein [Burkholderiales bacterium]